MESQHYEQFNNAARDGNFSDPSFLIYLGIGFLLLVILLKLSDTKEKIFRCYKCTKEVEKGTRICEECMMVFDAPFVNIEMQKYRSSIDE